MLPLRDDHRGGNSGSDHEDSEHAGLLMRLSAAAGRTLSTG
jgi:hypothetical protein